MLKRLLPRHPLMDLRAHLLAHRVLATKVETVQVVIDQQNCLFLVKVRKQGRVPILKPFFQRETSTQRPIATTS